MEHSLSNNMMGQEGIGFSVSGRWDIEVPVPTRLRENRDLLGLVGMLCRTPALCLCCHFISP